MATVTEDVMISSTEPASEDGLTHQERKVLYRLVVAGSVTAVEGSTGDSQLVAGLGLGPGIANEVIESLRHLVELGVVIRTPVTVESGDGTAREHTRYAARLEAQSGKYIPRAAVLNHLLAWFYVYGSFEYYEYRKADGTLYKSSIARALSLDESSTDQLRKMVVHYVDKNIVTLSEVVCSARWPGGRGKTIPIEGTIRTTLTLVSA